MTAFPQAGEKWSVGGNSISATGFLGTLNNFPINFKTNNVQRMTLTTAGFLGLGTAAPTVMFECTGNGKINNFKVNAILTVGNKISVSKIFSPAGIIDFEGSNLKTTAGISGASLAISSNGTFGSVIANSYQNPLFAGAGSGLVLSDANGSFQKLDFDGNQNTFLRGDGTFGSLQVNDAWKTVNGNIYTTGNFNVGIGIDSPIEKLDVNGNANIRGYLYVQDGVIIGKRIDGQRVNSDTIDVKQLAIKYATTDSLTSLKLATGKMAVTQDINIGERAKIGTNIVIDGLTNNITTPGNITAGNITAGTMNVANVVVDSSVVNSMQVVNQLKIGTGTLYLSSQASPDPLITENNIYTDNGPLKLQCNSDIPYIQNTIINSGNDGMVGIGTDVLNAKLNVNGTIRFDGINAQPNYVLTATDPTGLATWQPPLTHTGDVTGSDVLTISDNAITSSKILDGEVTYSKLNSMNAINGQVLKFNGTNWIPDDDNNTILTVGTNTGLSLNGTILNSVWSVDGNKIYNNTTGNLGIGTNNPGKKLHVNTSQYIELPDVEDPTEYSGSIRIQHDLTTGTDNHIFNSSIWDLEPLAFQDGSKRFSIGIPGNTSMFSINGSNGNIGVGTNNPHEKLEVNGGIKIGNTTTSNIGTIKFDGTNFLGCVDGNSWKSLSASNITEFKSEPYKMFYSDASGNITELSLASSNGLYLMTNGTAPFFGNIFLQGEDQGPIHVVNSTPGYIISIDPCTQYGGGIVPFPTSGNSAYVAWKTNAQGVPDWREDKQYIAGTNIQLTETNTSAHEWTIKGATYHNGTGITITGTSPDYTINSVWTESTDDIFCNNTGKVGIGTPSPQNTLHIKGNENLLFLEGSNNTALINWYPNGSTTRSAWTGFLSGSNTDDFIIRNETQNGDIIFGTIGNGNIGVGNWNPSEKLTVAGAINIGNTTNSSSALSGTIVFDNNEFKGKVGSKWDVFNLWKRLDQGGNIYYGGGFVGIGTNQPNAPLHIQSPWAGIILSNTTYGTGFNIEVLNQVTNLNSTGGNLALLTDASHSFQIISSGQKVKVDVNGTTIVDKLLVRAGNFGGEIKAKIDNTGNITCKKLTVQPNTVINIGDFVFDESYKIKSLYEEEQFYKQNKHLSNIPSAKEVSENGLDVYNFISLLLQKMEESTIHNVEQQKQIDALSKQIESLQNTIKNLQK